MTMRATGPLASAADGRACRASRPCGERRRRGRVRAGADEGGAGQSERTDRRTRGEARGRRHRQERALRQARHGRAGLQAHPEIPTTAPPTPTEQQQRHDALIAFHGLPITKITLDERKAAEKERGASRSLRRNGSEALYQQRRAAGLKAQETKRRNAEAKAEPSGRASSAGHRSRLGVVAPPGFPMKTPMLFRSDPRSTPSASRP